MTWSTLLLLLAPVVAAETVSVSVETPDPMQTTAAGAPPLPVVLGIEVLDDVLTPGTMPDLPTVENITAMLFQNVSNLPCLVPFGITEQPGENPQYHITYRNGCHYIIWQTLEWDPVNYAWVLVNAGPDAWQAFAEREAGRVIETAQNLTTPP